MTMLRLYAYDKRGSVPQEGESSRGHVSDVFKYIGMFAFSHSKITPLIYVHKLSIQRPFVVWRFRQFSCLRWYAVPHSTLAVLCGTAYWRGGIAAQTCARAGQWLAIAVSVGVV